MAKKPIPSYALVDPDDGPLPTEVDMYCAGTQPPEPVEWLWPGRIPIGKVTLVVGDPGLGKSLLAIDMAARITRGAEWPKITETGLKTPNPQSDIHNPKSRPSPPRSALVVSAEDDLADTIRARLAAAEADCDKVYVLPSLVDLRHELKKLRAAVDRLGDCRLVIIDPINAYVGPSDSHFYTVVRRVLAPLAELAREKRLAVVALANLRKHIAAAIYRTSGSMGFVSVARAVWTVCRDPEDPSNRRLFLPLKHNLAPAASGLAFTIEPRGPLSAPAIAWHPEPAAIDPETAVGPPAKSPGPEALEREAAGQWLRTALADGPRSAWDLGEEAHERGFSVRTLRRALHAIGGQTKKTDFLGGWMWSLPEDNKSKDASQEVQADKPRDSEPPVLFDVAWPLGDLSDDADERAPSIKTSIAVLERFEKQRDDDDLYDDEDSYEVDLYDDDSYDEHPTNADLIRSFAQRMLKWFGEARNAEVKCAHEADSGFSGHTNWRLGANQ